MTKHDFDAFIPRKGKDSWKWDSEGATAQFPMGTADMDYKCPQAVLDALQERIAHGILGYGRGVTLEFGSALSGYYQRRHGVDFKPEHFCTVSGLLLAINLLLDTFSRPGDQVIVQSPTYHNFRHVIEQSGREISDNAYIFDPETQTYSLDFDDLEARARSPRATMMVLCHPANPIGRVFSEEELRRIFDICQRNGVMIISDEVHCDIYHNGRKHIPLLSLSEEIASNSVLIGGSGKTFNLAGLYASYVMIPNEQMRERFLVTYNAHHFDYSILGVLANQVAYSECDDYIDGLLEKIAANMEIARTFLKTELPSVKMIEPDATYLLWLNFREWGLEGEALQQHLLKHGVGLSIGNKFGPDGDGFMRMNIACHEETLKGALNAMKSAYESL